MQDRNTGHPGLQYVHMTTLAAAKNGSLVAAWQGSSHGAEGSADQRVWVAWSKGAKLDAGWWPPRRAHPGAADDGAQARSHSSRPERFGA